MGGVQRVDELLMSLAVGAVSSSNNMVDEKREEGENSNVAVGAAEPANLQEEQRTSRYVTVSETDEEDDDDREQDIQLGPQYTLKEQIEKDKVCFT